MSPKRFLPILALSATTTACQAQADPSSPTDGSGLKKGGFHTTLTKICIMVLIPALALTSATANAQDTGDDYFGGDTGDYDESDYDESDYDESDYDESDYDESDYDESDYDESDYDKTDYDKTDYDESDYDKTDDDKSDDGNSSASLVISRRFTFFWDKEKFDEGPDAGGGIIGSYKRRHVFEAGVIEHRLGVACDGDQIRITSNTLPKTTYEGGREIDFQSSELHDRLYKPTSMRQRFRWRSADKQVMFAGQRYLNIAPTVDSKRAVGNVVTWNVAGVGGATLDKSAAKELELAMKASRTLAAKFGPIGKALKTVLKVLSWLDTQAPSKAISGKGAYAANVTLHCDEGQVRIKNWDSSSIGEEPASKGQPPVLTVSVGPGSLPYLPSE